MFKKEEVIVVFSEMNPWIDFCIVPHQKEDINKIMMISQNSYDNWFKEDTDETIIDYIKRHLNQNNLDVEIYSNIMNEDEEL